HAHTVGEEAARDSTREGEGSGGEEERGVVERLPEAHRLEEDLGLIIGGVVDDLEDADLFPPLAEPGEHERQEVVREPRIDTRGEEGGAALAAGVGQPVADLGKEGTRVNERDDRARDHVLSRGEDPADVLERLKGAEIRRRRVADAVGVEREQRIGVGGGADADRRETAERARILSRLGGAVHPEADQLKLGMTDDAAEGEVSHVPRAPLDDPIGHLRRLPSQSNGQLVVSDPPSTSTTLPVTHPPAGEQSQSAASAMSSTVPIRRIGVMASICWRSSSVRKGRTAEWSTAPTASAFTRTRGATSAASCRVMKESAALAVP